MDGWPVNSFAGLDDMEVFPSAPRADSMVSVRVVAALSGQQLSCQCKGTCTIHHVKREVERLWNIPWREQKLIFRNSVLGNTTPIGDLGASGEDVLSLIREEVLDFQVGDRVIAVADSAYLEWRKAGDQGIVVEASGNGEVVVLWDEHQATSPFSIDLPGANPYDILRLSHPPAHTFQVGDLVVAFKNGCGTATSSQYQAGTEGTIVSIETDCVCVKWNDASIRTSKTNMAHSHLGNPSDVVRCVSRISPTSMQLLHDPQTALQPQSDVSFVAGVL